MKRKYSLRKVKRIGLISAVIGFTLLNAPIYAESATAGGNSVSTSENKIPKPEGNIVAQGEDGVPWELYENGYLLFKPVVGKDTLTNDKGRTSWKVNYGSKIKHIGFSGKVLAPTDSSYLFSKYSFNLTNHEFHPVSIDAHNIDTSNVTDMSSTFLGDDALTTLNITNWDTSQVTNMSSMFSGVRSLTTLDIANWNTSKVMNMYSMFDSVSGLTTLDIGKWDTGKVTNMSLMFHNASKLTTINIGEWNTSQVTDMSWMFNNASGLKTLDIGKWDTSKVMNMALMFSYASGLTTLDIGEWNTSNVINMSQMFNNASGLTTLNISQWDTSSVTDMSYMFSDTSRLTTLNISQWNTGSVTNMRGMFSSAYGLTTLNIGKWDTSKVTDMSSMFYMANHITTLDIGKWNTSKVTNMSLMFRYMTALTTLDVSNWNTNNVTNISYMFGDTDKIINLDLNNWNTSKVTNMSYVFANAIGLKNLTINKWDTSKVTDMSAMFYRASGLTTLNLDRWNTSNVRDMRWMFIDMYNLTTLNISSWDMNKVILINDMLGGTTKLKELKLGDKFKADGIRTIPTIHNYGNQYTDKWYKVDDKSHLYTVSEWATDYAANPTVNAGTWVREEKAQDAVLTFDNEHFAPVTVTPDSASLPQLPRPSQPKRNHKFLGWSRSQDQTIITREGVQPGEEITLYPVWQPVDNVISRPEAIPVTTTYRGDNNLDYGKRNETPGTPGEKRITTTYTVAPYTGELTNPVESTEILTHMISTVIAIGTKPTVTKSNPVTKTTRVTKDDTKPIGYRYVETEGSDGYTETITHYDVDPTTGTVTERTETRTVPPVERVVTEGALAYDLPTTGTVDMTITLAGLAGTLVITKRKKPLSKK